MTVRARSRLAILWIMVDRRAEEAPPEGPSTEGLDGSPLRPDEDEYRTGSQPATDPPEGPAASPAAEPRPWIVVGLVLLVLFIAGLAYAVVLPLFV